MQPSPEELADEVYAADNGVVVELTLVAAAATLFCFDYSLTFAREVEHIWKRGFSTTAVLFYFFRYLGLITTIFAVIAVAGWTGISPKSCSIMVHVAWVQDVVILSAAVVFSALRACALCRGDKRVFIVVLLLGCPNPAIAGYTYAMRLNFYTTSLAARCSFRPDMSDAVFGNWVIGARSSAVLTDMIVLGITIWKARPVQVLGIAKSTVANILMRDGVLYFGVLLFTNLVGLILVWDFILILPLGIGTTILTAIMTCRFILDLREAADPRFNDLSTSGGGGTSHLIFPDASTHAPCFDPLGTNTTSTGFPDPSSEDGKNTSGFAEYSDDAESEARQRQICLTTCEDGRGIMEMPCGDVESVIWIR